MHAKEAGSNSPLQCVLWSYLQDVQSDVNTAVIQQYFYNPLFTNWKGEVKHEKIENSAL